MDVPNYLFIQHVQSLYVACIEHRQVVKESSSTLDLQCSYLDEGYQQ